MNRSYWRFLFTPQKDAFFSMATDEVLTALCQEENRIPTLRVYTWFPPAVSIGYFQRINSTIDIDKCRKSGIDIVRRPTGGRAVLHQDEITYSICATSDNFPQLGDSVSKTYRQISLAFLEALRILGIEAKWTRSVRKRKKEDASEPCFASSSKYEVNMNNRKLVGSAQRRFGNVFLQHGSIPLRESQLSLAYFLPQEEDKNNKTGQQLRMRSTNMEELLGRNIRAEELIEAVKCGFKKHFKIEFIEQEFSYRERDEIERLARRKYSRDWWNLLR